MTRNVEFIYSYNYNFFFFYSPPPVFSLQYSVLSIVSCPVKKKPTITRRSVRFSLSLSLYFSCSLCLLLFATFHSSVAVATTATNDKRPTVMRTERRRLLNDPPIRHF